MRKMRRMRYYRNQKKKMLPDRMSHKPCRSLFRGEASQDRKQCGCDFWRALVTLARRVVCKKWE